jgi:uncharacterized membrane protein YkvA (DUF1232 family)
MPAVPVLEPEILPPSLPATMARHARIVREGFWTKLLHKAGRVPFAEDLAAAYFCVIDPATPTRVRGLLLAVLAYFVLPFDIIPTMFIALGLASDAAVLAAGVRLIAKYLKPHHYAQARAVLGIDEAQPDVIDI